MGRRRISVKQDVFFKKEKTEGKKKKSQPVKTWKDPWAQLMESLAEWSGE